MTSAQELKVKAISTMDNCFLEVGAEHQKFALPPALRSQIYDQFMQVLATNPHVKLMVEVEGKLPELGRWCETNSICSMYYVSQKDMLEVGYHKVISLAEWIKEAH